MDDARRRTLILAICCLAQFMVILDVSIVNIALPSMKRDLGFSDTDLQWVVNAYTLAFAGFLLLGGRAADLIGHRQVLVAGVLTFTLASLLGGSAQSQAMLVGARAVQGLGGALAAPATLAVLTTTFPQGPERNRALAFWGAMGGVGGAAGAVFGGLLTDLLSWRWILFINIPIGLVAAVIAMRVVAARGRDADPTHPQHFDLLGAVVVTLGLVVTVFGIVRTDVDGWGSGATVLRLAVGVALLAAFVLIEGRFAREPLMPLRMFRARSLSAAGVVVCCMAAAAFPFWYFVSLFEQERLGWSPLQAGLSFLPMTVALIFASTVAGRVASRVGPAVVLSVGMTALATGMALYSGLPADAAYVPAVLGPGLLCGIGIGCSFVPVTISALSDVERSESGIASGLVNTFRQVGGSFGLAVLATLAVQHTQALRRGGDGVAEAFTGGLHRAFLFGAAFAAVGVVLTVTLLLRRPRPPARNEVAPQTRTGEPVGA